MKYDQVNNNRVFLRGKVVSEPVYSHETFGEGFYEINLEVPRLSENSDKLPVTVSEKLIKSFEMGKEICIKGQFRSYNKVEDAKSKLLLSVFVREIMDIDESMNPNIIELTGFLCKPPIYRTTPFKREICDMLIAVNRSYNKSDYLPCIAWGRNARYIKDVQVGTKVDIVGRVQSREYQKKLDNGVLITKTAFEISVNRIQMSDKAQNSDNILLQNSEDII